MTYNAPEDSYRIDPQAIVYLEDDRIVVAGYSVLADDTGRISFHLSIPQAVRLRRELERALTEVMGREPSFDLARP